MASTSVLTHTRAHTHTFNRASHLSNNSTAGTSVGFSELAEVWICCDSFFPLMKHDLVLSVDTQQAFRLKQQIKMT